MKKILLFFCILQFLVSFAQNAADIDHDFKAGPGFDNSGIGTVSCMITQPDGKIIIKGSNIYRNIQSKVLIRLNLDGSIDPTFSYEPGSSFTIECIALQPDGKILLGSKDIYDKIRVMRLNADGSRDNSFQVVNGIPQSIYVNTITPQADGKILVALKGFTYSYAVKNLIRLNTDGSLDTTFDVGTGFNDDINSIVVQADGKIIAGGEFTSFRGIKEGRIIRLNEDGTKDPSFVTGTGLSSYVYSIAIQNDGKLIVGGSFSKYQDVVQRYLIRLNPDGSKDASFTNPSNFKDMDYRNVSHISLLPDGKIVASFYYYNGTSFIDDVVYCFNLDGSNDTSFPRTFFRNDKNLLTGNMDADVNAMVVLNNGKILIGGKFTYCRDVIEKNMVCLNADGSRDSSFNKDTGFDTAVLSSVIQTDGKTLVGGNFDNFQGVTQKKLMRLNPDGSKDTSFNLDSEFNNEVQSLLLQADGKILVRGEFTKYGDSQRNYLVRLNPDGKRDVTFLRTSEYAVNAMALQPDGKIIIQTYASNWPSAYDLNKVIRLNSNGTPDPSFVTGNGNDFDKAVYDIAVQPDGKILLGGAFTNFRGVTQNYLTRLNPDGKKDTSFDAGTLYDKAINVSNIVLQPDGRILISGLFSPTAGDYKNYLVRLNPDGTKDTSFNQAVGIDNERTGYGIGIRSVVLQNDGKILVGGEFDTFQGIPQNRLTRLNPDGTVDTSFDVEAGFLAPVESISLYPDGKINVGGLFSSYRDVTSSYYVRLKGTYVKPALNATTIQTNVICPGSSTGSASIVTVYDGKSPYTYLWSNGATTSEIMGLADGKYSCTITDAESSTVTKNFIIITDSDLIKPTITAPAAVTINANDGCTVTGVVLGTPVTSDNCAVASVTNNAPEIFPVGNTTVTWTVTDVNNNVTTATQIVTIKDIILPTIIAPAQLTVNTNLDCAATDVVLGTPVTADNCSVASVTNNAPKSFPLGNTTVTWTVKDASNNVAKATQIVTVKDLTPPTITAPAAVIVNAGLNCEATGVALGTPITADNCTVASVRNNAPTSFPLGNTIVTWTIRDKSNNVSTATQIVSVKGPDATITYNEGKLSVAETEAVYKWLICNNGSFTLIPNENKSVFSPKQLGSYAVEVTKNGCTSISTCFDIKVLGTKDFDIQSVFKLYPNPVNDIITIETNSVDNAKLNVFDVTGNIIISKELKTTLTKLNISNLPVGVYLFRISNDIGNVTKKVIKD